MNKISTYILSKFKQREIYRRDGELYLTRYYLFRKITWWMPSIYIHCFHASDEDQELHSHPWLQSISLILSGSYKEEFRIGDEVRNRIYSPGMINFIRKDKFHRVDLLSNNVWSIFISGSKVTDWGFWDRDSKIYKPWREHVSKNNTN